mgnify:FL=1
MFEIATRKKAKLRLALTGPSGSGKTLSALMIAGGMTDGDWSRVALIDTEHERARFYADRSEWDIGEFLYQPLIPPYKADRYIEIAKAGAEAVGEDGVLIVDSLSHAWEGEGGVLEYKAEVEKQKGKNSYTAWDEAGKVQNALITTLLSLPCHVIVTLRTKTAYAMELNDRGKNVPVKIGLAPIQRETTEYEFDVVLNLDRAHYATASKDTTFLDDFNAPITPEIGQKLRGWLAEGAEPDRCADCGHVILPERGVSVEQIVAGTIAAYGRKLCMSCAERAKNAAAQTISN